MQAERAVGVFAFYITFAAHSGHTAVLELLSTGGADLSSKSKDGMTPGHLAARGGHVAMLELLSTNGAD